MKKRPKSTNYLGMEGKGPTLREAKADAMRKIEQALGHDYTPAIFAAGDYRTIVWRTPFGVRTSTLRAEEPNGLVRCCGMTGVDAFERECDAMALHVAQLAANVESQEIPACIAGKPSLVNDYLSWIGFQRAFRAATKAGEEDAHRWACNHGHEFRPVLEAV